MVKDIVGSELTSDDMITLFNRKKLSWLVYFDKIDYDIFIVKISSDNEDHGIFVIMKQKWQNVLYDYHCIFKADMPI